MSERKKIKETTEDTGGPYSSDTVNQIKLNTKHVMENKKERKKRNAIERRLMGKSPECVACNRENSAYRFD